MAMTALAHASEESLQRLMASEPPIPRVWDSAGVVSEMQRSLMQVELQRRAERAQGAVWFAVAFLSSAPSEDMKNEVFAFWTRDVDSTLPAAVFFIVPDQKTLQFISNPRLREVFPSPGASELVAEIWEREFALRENPEERMLATVYRILGDVQREVQKFSVNQVTAKAQNELTSAEQPTAISGRLAVVLWVLGVALALTVLFGVASVIRFMIRSIRRKELPIPADEDFIAPLGAKVSSGHCAILDFSSGSEVPRPGSKRPLPLPKPKVH